MTPIHENIRFITALTLSTIIHIFSFFLFDHYLFSPPELKEKVSKELRIKAIIVDRTARVDVVQMPQYTLQELKKMEEEFEESTRIEKQRGIFLRLLKDMASREIENEPRETQKLPSSKTRPRVLMMAGNKLSKGMALSGGSRDPEMDDFHQYLDSVPFPRPEKSIVPFLIQGYIILGFPD